MEKIFVGFLIIGFFWKRQAQHDANQFARKANFDSGFSWRFRQGHRATLGQPAEMRDQKSMQKLSQLDHLGAG